MLRMARQLEDLKEELVGGEKNLIVSGVDKDLVGNRRHRRLQHADPTLPLTDKG